MEGDCRKERVRFEWSVEGEEDSEGEGWGLETGGGESNETGSVTKKEGKQSTTDIGASLYPYFRDKGEETDN